MKNMPSSKTAKLLALLLLLPPALAPLVRGQVTVNSSTVITSTDDLPLLSLVTFANKTGTIVASGGAGNEIIFDSADTASNHLGIANNVAASFVIEDGVHLAFAHGNPGANGGAITINGNAANPSALSFLLGKGALLEFSNNRASIVSGNNPDGGAISIGISGTLLIDASADGASFLFSNNNTANRGGAIFSNSLGITTLRSGTIIGNSTNTGNGGGIAALGAARVDLTNVVFASNTASSGGALFNNSNASSIVRSSTFQNNYATTIGGGVSIQGTSTMTMTDVAFIGNTAANNGGAVQIQANGSRFTASNALFQSNTAVNNGGAFMIQNNSYMTLTDFSVLDNHSGGGGGGFYLDTNGQLTLNVSANASSTIAGNTAGSAAGVSNGITFNNAAAAATGTFNIGDNARLDMLDPMTASSTSAVNITKTGNGTWNLGGNNTLSDTAATTFNVTAGTLHLYAAAETSGTYKAATAGAGKISLGNGAFTLSAGATLSAGGGNSITAPTIALGASSTLALDMFNAAALTASGSSLLTLNATTFNINNWSQGLSLLNLGSLSIASSATYNLITLGGDGTLATANLFTDSSFNTFANVTGLLGNYSLGTTLDGLTLQLYYTFVDSNGNHVLLWTGGAAGNTWGGNNWLIAGAAGTGATFTNGDIVNLVDTPAANSGTLNVTTAGVSAAGIYVSGTASYTIAGANGITASATAGEFTGGAATGKLVLGAQSSDAGDAVNPLDFTGTLTLANGANNFEGGIEIDTGVLVGSAANFGATGTDGVAVGIAIAAPGTLVFDQTATGAYAAPITGQGALVKTNTGALTLAADNSSFTGATDINAGSLLLAPAATLGGDIAVHTGATLDGANGASAGNVTIDTGATLQVGLGNTALQSFSLSTLSLNDGSLLNYTNLANTLNITGQVSLLGSGTINLGTMSLGAFPLIDAGSYTGIDPTQYFAINYNGSLFETDNYTLSLTSGTLWLDILTLPLPANNVLTWTNAAGDAAWLDSKNWTTAVAGVSATTRFSQGDIVNLSDAGATAGAITLADSATATAIYVSGNANHAIAGAGALTTATNLGILSGSAAANGKLTLGANVSDAATAPATAYTAFTGTLDLTGLTGTNNFTGGVEINTGALRISNTAQLGTTLNKLSLTGTGALIAAGNMTFASLATGSENRLVIPANTVNDFVLEDGVTLTFTRNIAPGGSFGSAAGAITLGANASLTLTAGNNAQYVFTSNTANDGGAIGIVGATLTLTGSVAGGSGAFSGNYATTRGGAIYIGSNATVNVDNVIFSKNTAGTNGGAIAALTSSTIIVSNVLFSSNTGQVGGALFGNTSSQIYVQSSTFDGNRSTATGGGAIGIQNGAGNAFAITTLRDIVFTSNSASVQGGAIMLQCNNSVLDAARILFDSNAAGTTGGAVSIGNATNSGTITDSTFTSNTAATNGGAIYIAGGTLALNVTDNGAMLFADNKAAGAPNSIYFNGATTVTVDIGANGTLDMLDPMGAANAATTITKTGLGAWNLGGDNTLGTTTAAAINFTVSQGALHLYNAIETSGTYSAATAGAGNLNIAGGSFNLNAGATLSAGGGNTLAAPTITLAASSTIAIDLFGALPNTSASLLTLNASTLLDTANWSQTLNLLHLADLDNANNDTYNLITLTGAGAAGSLFDTTLSNNFLNITGTLDGFTLQIADSGSTLQLVYFNAGFMNTVLTWTGTTDSTWRGINWLNATTLSATTYARGDIVNLGGPTAAPSATTTINIDSPTGVTVSGMYLSGNENYTITGNGITTAATSGTFAGAAGAATGQLVLGANARSDATDADTLAYTGTLTLTNTGNNFENGIDIRSGALVGNAANLAVGADAGITIADAGSLTFDQTASATYSSAITGAGALAKTGAATLTLTAGNSAFGGTTSVSSGALLLAPAAALGGDIHVNATATFGGAGAAGNVTLDPGATLQIGTLDSGLGTPGSGTLTLTSNLNLAAGAALNYANNTNTLLVNGLITQSGLATINLLGSTLTVGGSYSLIDAAGGWSGAGFDPSLFDVTYKDTLLAAGSDYIFAPDASGLLWLNILNIPIAGNTVITWNGAANDGLWLASNNWTTQSVTKAFRQGDIVNLNDTGNTEPLITLTDSATTAGMYVSGATNYAITGAGGIIASATIGDLSGSAAATGKLTLGKTAAEDAGAPALATFTGTLDFAGLTGTNNFTGGVEINTGALRISNTAQLGTTLSNLAFTGTTGDAALIAAAGSNMTFDGASGAANRLSLTTAGATATFVLEDSATLTFANSNLAANSTGGAINVGAGAHLAIETGTEAQLVFSDNKAGNSSGGDAGAIMVNNGGSLLIDASAANGFLFTGNNAQNRGGAIFALTGVVTLANGAFKGNYTNTGNGGALGAAWLGARIQTTDVVFTSNTASQGGALFLNSNASALVQSSTFLYNTATGGNGGGAAAIQGTSTLTMTDAAFLHNTAATNGGALEVQVAGSRLTGSNAWFEANTAATGGAIYMQDATTLDLANATFTANISATNGGAIAIQGASTIVTLSNVTFTSNTAAYGGAIFNNSASTILTITNALFRGNTATVDGGALGTGTASSNAATWNLANVSFLDNTAGIYGGAIFQNGPIALNYTITDSATIAGNMAGGSSNGITFSNYGSPAATFNITTGAHLDMLDPMLGKIANTGSLVVTQTGGGLWNLGGQTILGPNNTGQAAQIAFTVSSGTLHLYRAAETTCNGNPVATGNLGITGTTTNSFTLAPDATLSAGGGNTLAAPTINLAANSTIALDLFSAAALTASGSSILTLAATTINANGWSQTIDLLNPASLGSLTQGDTFDLITLTDANHFTTADGFTLLGAPDLTLYHLQLDITGSILQLYYGAMLYGNNVLTWTNAAGNANWSGLNWMLTADMTTSATYKKNDIVNLADAGTSLTTPVASATINIDTAATIAAMAVSGTANYTITGNAITTAPVGGDYTGSAAATGQLILGAYAAADASTLDPLAYTGTLTLLNTSNNFQNGIVINTGALVGNAANLATGTAGIAIGAPGSLTFDQSAAATYASPITGQGSLVKTNTGALTLTANNSSFTGITDINAGALRLSASAALGGAIHVNATATFGGAGAAGNVTLDPGATLQIGTLDSGLGTPGSGTLTLTSNLNLAAGSLLAYTNNDNTLYVGGLITVAASQTTPVSINLADTTLTVGGSYSLINAAGGWAGTGFDPGLFAVNYKNALLTEGADYLFTPDASGILWLDILNVPILGNNVLTWNGSADNLWLASNNWTTQSATKAFLQGDIVNLNDTNTSGRDTLALADTATTSAIYVSGNINYAITGTGALAAATGVGELSGSAAASGKLTLGKTAAEDAATITTAAYTGTLDLTGLTGTNNFTGGVEINSGALRIANAAQLGATLNKLTFTSATGAANIGTLIAAGDTTFDSAAGNTNHLALAANTAAAFVVEDGATLTFANNVMTTLGGALTVNAGANLSITTGSDANLVFNNNRVGVTNDGGAISAGSGATLFIDASAPGSGFLFSNNTGGNRGGAIFANTATVILFSGTFSGNSNATGNGGALAALNVSTVTLKDILFTSNTANQGSSLFNNGTTSSYVQSSTFLYNTATLNGGAIGIQGSSTMIMNDVAFIGNRAYNNGGAGFMQTAGGAFIATNILFQSNSAANTGGVFNITEANTLDLTDFAILDNTSGAGAGGVVNAAGPVTLNFTVTAANTSTIAGNTANGLSNSIYFANAGPSAATFTIADNARLDMLDPMTASSGAISNITKTGAGTWNLGGNNTLGAAPASTLAIAQGALHLYRAGETSGAYTAATGNLTLGGSFTLATGATLSAGGRNTITAPTLTLAPASTLALDMAAAAPNTTLLTLNATSQLDTANWGQTLNLLNLADLEASNNDIFPLITLAGAGAAGSPFTDTAFNNLANITGLIGGYTLQIANSGSTLQLLYLNDNLVNNILTWTAATDNTWRAINWIDALTGAAATYAKGDIVNLSNTPAPAASSSSTININSAAGATVAAMYVSGTENYTLTGAPLATSATIGTLTGSAAATGKLTLGAIAADANTVTAAAYTGTLTLANTGTNNFENGIDIRAGSLVGNAATLHAGTTATTGVTIAAAASLTFDQAANATYASFITGNGSLVKTNTGALTLTASNAAFGGTTSVSSGALLLAPVGASQATPSPAAPAALGGSINVATGATFGGAGTAGSVTLAPGATLQVGLRTLDSGLGTPTPASGTLILISNLNLSAGSLLDYTTLTNQLLVGGNATLAGESTLNLGAIATGSFSLINAAGGLSNFNASLIDITYKGALLESDDYTLATSGNQLWLTFLTLPNNVLTWTNASGDSLWLTSTNWKVNGANITKSFRQGDIIDLAGAGLSPTAPLTLAASATAAAIYVSGNANYTLAGADGLTTDATLGVLAGAPAATGKLVLGATAASATTAPVNTTFTGTLDLTALTGVNKFTNGIDINSGVLRVANAGQLGTTLDKLTFNTTVNVANGGVSSTPAGPAGALSIAGDLTLDGNHTAANRLTVSASAVATFLLDDGVKLTIANNTTPSAGSNNSGGAITIGNRALVTINGAGAGENAWGVFSGNTVGTGDGGAISLGANAALILGGADNAASFLFANNTAQNRGGAIFGNTATLDITNAIFSDNKGAGTGNGGALAFIQKSTLTLTNVLFASNTTGGVGGAIFNNTNTITTITNGTFANNTSTSTGAGNGGGAIAVQGTSALTVLDSIFTGNYAASQGGALYLQTNGSTLNVTRSLFTSNSANNGGAVAVMTANEVVFIDSSLNDNNARAAGGAIYLATSNGGADIEVTTGKTSQIAGNTAAAIPNSVYMTAATGQSLVVGVAENGALDMLDPIATADTFGSTITKNGPGLWNLGGANQIGAGAALAYVNFDITAGTLHLYRAGETSANPATSATYTAATGNITMTGASSFTLERGATLSAGGGNTITAPAILLDPASALTLDLFNATPNAPAAPSILTLNATTLLNTGGWTQSLTLLDLDTLAPPADGSTYNLITITGAGATSNISPFYPGGAFISADTFALANTPPAEYSLQLTPDAQTLQLLYTAPVTANTVLTWNGSDAANTWLGENWLAPTGSATFTRGDIINIATPLATPSATLNVNTLATATIAGMYVSGTANTTLTGNPIVADADASLLAGAPAATGKLILGAIATDSGLLTPDSYILTPSTFTGTLTLSNTSNNFLGGIEILTGALIGNAATLGSGTAGIDIATAASLTFNQPTPATYTAPITGAGALAKTGAATLTLAADNSSFGGTTSVSSGALLLAPAAGGTTSVSSAAPPAALGGDIQVAPAATFGGAGSAGAVTLAPNATLQIGLRTQDTGLSDQTSNLNLSNLNLSDSAILNYTALGNTLTVGSGGVTVAGSSIINIPAFQTTGTYNLGNLATLANSAQLTIDGLAQYTDARSQATLSTSANGADLLLTTTRDISRVLTWTAATSNTWALTGADWNDTTNQVHVFGAGDKVIFDNTGATSPDITIASSGALVSDMTVDSDANYTITGGAITADAISAYSGDTTTTLAADATGKLTKTGAGALTLSTTAANTFLGGIDLDAGALVLGGTTSVSSITRVAPAATLQMTDAGRLNTADLALAATTTLAGNGAIHYDHLTLTGDGLVHADIAAGDILTLTSTIRPATPALALAAAAPTLNSSAGFLKTGEGELRFNGAGAFGDSSITQIDAGLVRITGFASGSTTVIPASMMPLSSGGDYLYLPTGTYPITETGGYITVPAANIYFTSGYATIPIAGGTYTMSGDVIVPACTVTIGGTDIFIPSSTVAFPATAYSTPTVTATIVGSFAIIPSSSFTIPNYLMAASAITQNMLLNGGTLAFGAGNAGNASGANGGNDNLANDWRGLRLIQGDNAPSSVITGGANDLIYLGAGAFAPQLAAGLHVAINAGNDTATLTNLSNNFTGIVLVNSGTLQVSDARQLGAPSATNNTKIALAGGSVEFTTSMTFAGDLALRAPINTIVTDDAANVTWTRIYRDATFTPGNATLFNDNPSASNSGALTVVGAALVKAGAGTMTLTGANQSTGLEVDAGRLVITNASGLPNGNGPIVIHDGAVLQLNQNLAAGSATTAIGAFAGADYIPSTSGNINSAFYGSGTLEITGSNQYVLNNNANSDIAHINITGPGAALATQVNSLSPKGTITIDQAALILAADTQTLGNIILKNSATMGFLMVNSSTTVGANTYVAKPMRTATLASLTAAGDGIPKLWFNTNISQGLADHLTINTPVTGTFSVNVINLANTDNTGNTGPIPNAAVNMELIHSPAPAANTGAFLIGTPSIDIGNYKYDVTGATTTIRGNSIYSVNITGNGDMSRTAAAIYAAAAMTPVSWFSELDSVTQRLGDLHLDTRGDKAGFAAWTRGYAEKLNFNRNLTGAGFNERHLGAEAGLDYKFGRAWNLYAGAYMGYGQTQRDNIPTASSDNADAGNQSTFGGLYATLVSPAHGWYADAVLKLNRFRNRFTITDPSSAQPASVDYHNTATGASLEIGKRQPILYKGDEAWFLTPMLQVAHTRVCAETYTATNGATIALDAGATTLARAGIKFGRDIETAGHGTISAYLKASYGHQWTTGSAVTIALPDGSLPGRFASKIDGLNLTAGAGIAWQFTNATQLYFDYETTQTDYYTRPYGLNLGLRHNW